MFEKSEVRNPPTQAAWTRVGCAASVRPPSPASSLTPAADRNHNILMLGTVRFMLGLAVEGAFELRSGQGSSGRLRHFDAVLDAQRGLLDSLESADFTSDPGFLTRRARLALDDFAAAVRQEVVDRVRPGIDSAVFHAALERMTDRAVAAGVAFAFLDLALDHPL